MKRILAVTGSRADYGIYRPLFQALSADPEIELSLLVTGTHLSATHGYTLSEIERDGFTVGAVVPNLSSADDPKAIALAMTRVTQGVAEMLAARLPNLLLLCGDRYEMLAAASAALPFALPLAHLHGGELTAGAFDDAIRHALTKLSHLHFVAHDEAARRLFRMGEEPWRITVTGAPSLDFVRGHRPWSRSRLDEYLGIPSEVPFFLGTFHSTTLHYRSSLEEAEAWLAALSERPEWLVLTGANADTYGERLNSRFRAFAELHPRCRFHPSLGSEAYLSALAWARLMTGNSSSGIIEAPSFRLPVVDVGRRQENRLRAGNVIHADAEPKAISRALATAATPQFRKSLAGLVNPYDRGGAAPLFHARLREVCSDSRLLIKKFIDIQDREKTLCG